VAYPRLLPHPAVAVDAYCLLHRGAYTCSRELVEGEPTVRHVQYCMARIDLLIDAGAVPLVVFDGGRLPNKLDEERTRERNREENRARARDLWQQGNKGAAMECYQRAVDIQPAHAKQFVEVGAVRRWRDHAIFAMPATAGKHPPGWLGGNRGWLLLSSVCLPCQLPEPPPPTSAACCRP
jgi:hypothetical protein